MTGNELSQPRRLRDLLQPGLWLLVWVYLYIVAMLTAWVVIASSIGGWHPVVVTGGSMSPSLSPGDVVLVGDIDERRAQGAVITFSDPADPDQLITHRVFEVTDHGYVTKGDANATPDLGVVAGDQVQGAARLVVPFIGMPILWWQAGNLVALAAFAVFTVLAVVVGVRGTRRYLGEPKRRAGTSGAVVAETALRRVRILVGALMATQFITDSSRFDLFDGRVPAVVSFALTLGVLAGINVASVAVSQRGDERLSRRFSILELVVDTALVIAITAPGAAAGIGWVLFALPIIEAATRFRLTGALVHWMALTGVTVITRTWALSAAGASGGLMLGELEQTMDQLSVLLLVVLPGAYLAEQLLNDVTAQVRATNESRERNRLLQRVVEIGRDVNRLDSEIVETLTASALALGFDGTDAWASTADGSWKRLSSAGAAANQLPPAGEAGSGLRSVDLDERAVIVDLNDPEETERAALESSGLALLARVRLVDVDGTSILLRAGLTTNRTSSMLALEGLELLASQASVAMHNDRLIAELRDAHAGMFRQASQDALTGLANRARFLEVLGEAMVRARSEPDAGVAVLFLDLDGFKPVNDRLGHEAGDILLCAVANRIVARLRDTDLVARFGGDEFTILLNPGRDRTTVEEVARRVHGAVEEPFAIANKQVSIGVSIGIALSNGAEDSPDEILRRADMAMYHAKGDGSLHWSFYEAEMGERDEYRSRVATDLPGAFYENRMELHYQPLHAITPGHPLVGAEALLRWTHPDLGRIPAPQVVEVAEQLGLGDELTRWVLTNSCRAAVSWNETVAQPLVVTANLTPYELESPDLLDHVGAALSDSGLAPELLILELSERILGPDNPASDANLFGLQDMGVRLILDDFGQGRTSLAYLRGLPIEGIKLDRAFVVNSIHSADDRIIVESVVRLAHELGLSVVAEGVERAEHLSAVEAMGCDILQGYHLGRPAPEEQFAATLTPETATTSWTSSLVGDGPTGVGRKS